MYESTSVSKKMAVCAACIALAFILNQITLFRMPQGGSITPASMLFAALAGYWLGPVYGIIAGVSKGLLDTMTGAFVVHPIQYLLDYPMAFGMLGLSGFFRKMNFGLQIGYIVGVLGRLLMVFISGLVFFSDITGMGLAASVTFSFVYNITYIGPELAVSLVIISLPSVRHAIDAITKSIAPQSDYIIMMKNKGSVSTTARLITGGVISAFGGLAFVLVSHISRLENLSIIHYTTGAVLFTDEPARIARMIERNTGQLASLQTVGVIFLALGITLIFSTLLEREKEI